jgi:hypothetical protein
MNHDQINYGKTNYIYIYIYIYIITNLTMVTISITKLVIFIFNILLFYPNKFNHN